FIIIKFLIIIINQISLIMKKSIHLMVVAVLALTNAVSAANIDSSTVFITGYVESADAKFVSYADASLIESELGSLKKSDRSIADKINADLQITEGILPTVVELKNSAAPINLDNK